MQVLSSGALGDVVEWSAGVQTKAHRYNIILNVQEIQKSQFTVSRFYNCDGNFWRASDAKTREEEAIQDFQDHCEAVGPAREHLNVPFENRSQRKRWFCEDPLENIFETGIVESGVQSRTTAMKSIFKHLSPQSNINNRLNQPTRNWKQTAKSRWDVSIVKSNHRAVNFPFLFICTDGRKFPAVQHHGERMKTFQRFILTRTECFRYCHLTFVQNPKLKRSNESSRDFRRDGRHSI